MDFCNNQHRRTDLINSCVNSHAVGGRMLLADQSSDLFDLRAPAIHEAGHTFAARSHGFEVAWVSMDPDFLMNSPLSIGNTFASCEAVSMVVATPCLRPIFQRGIVKSRNEWKTIEGYFVERLAGSMAENTFIADRNELCPRDFQQAWDLLEQATRPFKTATRDRRFRQFMSAAHDFVELHRNVIFHLGAIIRERRTIIGCDIDIAIAEARWRAALQASPIPR